MAIEYRQGNLFEATDLQTLAHGCNCAGVMGKGIALEFKRRYPAMYQAYRQLCTDGQFNLGDMFVWGKNPAIFNLATQQRPGPHADLDAIETALGRMIVHCEQANITKVGLPRIGAGIGGLQWAAVQPVIENAAFSTEVLLVVFEFKPTP